MDRFAQWHAGFDHHWACHHADAQLKLQQCHRIDHGQCRLERHRGGVFVGQRQPKKAHHAVIALRCIRLPAPTAHHVSTGGMEAVKGFTVAFGAQRAQQAGGVDQVIAQHGHLAQMVVRMRVGLIRRQQGRRVAVADQIKTRAWVGCCV